MVLAREMTLQDIATLRDKTPPALEIEAFVHGAMCMSISGRCLLSNYMAGRDAHRGQCAQPCRWKYYLSEETRPGQRYEIDVYKRQVHCTQGDAMRSIEDIQSEVRKWAQRVI